MRQIIYTSTATEPMEVGALSELLEHAREKNERLAVTGLLLYKNGSFMQAFEGEEETVRRLYSTIKADERHDRIITLSKESVAERSFPDWAMGFRHLGNVAPGTLPKGFAQIMRPDFDPDAFDAKPGYARNALLGFKDAAL